MGAISAPPLGEPSIHCTILFQASSLRIFSELANRPHCFRYRSVFLIRFSTATDISDGCVTCSPTPSLLTKSKDSKLVVITGVLQTMLRMSLPEDVPICSILGPKFLYRAKLPVQ